MDIAIYALVKLVQLHQTMFGTYRKYGKHYHKANEGLG